jgi:hypothetical protein
LQREARGADQTRDSPMPYIPAENISEMLTGDAANGDSDRATGL